MDRVHSRSPNIVSGRLSSIQLLRAAAAVSVCIAHALHEEMFVYPSKAVDFLSGLPWGGGVDLFFVISGFIMMYTFGNRFGTAGATYDFALRRLIRIVPPYWFFTTLIVMISIITPSLLNTAVFTPSHALLSYLFIPHTDPGPEGGFYPILGLGWTLLYEMFFYVVFSIALFLNKIYGLIMIFIAFSALFIASKAGMFSILYGEFFGNTVIFEFLIGIVLAICLNDRKLTWTATVLISIFCVLSWLYFNWLGLTEERLFLRAPFVIIIFLLTIHLQDTSSRIFLIPLLIGDASYTLYLVHPFAVKAAKIVLSPLNNRVTADLTAALFVPFCVAVSVVVAVTLFIYLEKPVTKALQRRFLRRPAGP